MNEYSLFYVRRHHWQRSGNFTQSVDVHRDYFLVNVLYYNFRMSPWLYQLSTAV